MWAFDGAVIEQNEVGACRYCSAILDRMFALGEWPSLGVNGQLKDLDDLKLRIEEAPCTPQNRKKRKETTEQRSRDWDGIDHEYREGNHANDKIEDRNFIAQGRNEENNVGYDGMGTRCRIRRIDGGFVDSKVEISWWWIR